MKYNDDKLIEKRLKTFLTEFDIKPGTHFYKRMESAPWRKVNRKVKHWQAYLGLAVIAILGILWFSFRSNRDNLRATPTTIQSFTATPISLSASWDPVSTPGVETVILPQPVPVAGSDQADD